MAKISDEPAIVLNTRPYRERSLLVSLMTLNHGRVTAVARGQRGQRRQQPLQPFTRVSVSWYGRSSLVTLGGIDSGVNPWLQGERAASGFYVFELITRLLHEGEVQPNVFMHLCLVIEELAGTAPVSPLLRRFEQQLLKATGYGLDFEHEAITGEPIKPEVNYELILGEGFVEATAVGSSAYQGRTLLTIANQEFTQPVVARTARQIFRRCLDEMLGPKPLISRQLIRVKS